MNEITDDTMMPFGKYKGKKMANVPASYLIWLNDQDWFRGGIKKYVTDNIDVLREEALNHEDNKKADR